MAGTVIFLGAGATKACDGPLTSEILPALMAGPYAAGPATPLLTDFLRTLFHVDAGSPAEHYPGLPLVMSLIDTALDRRQAFHPDWDLDRVSKLRQEVELLIFDLLEDKLNTAPTNSFYRLMDITYPAPAEPCIVSTNYDLIADTAMMFLSQARTPDGCLPNYRIPIRTAFYTGDGKRFGTLLKLHGSLNWLHCRTCQRVEIGASAVKRYLRVLERLVGPTLQQSYTADGQPCSGCGTRLRPLLIAPSHLKDYRNPHLAQVWYEAERVLREADRAIFIGYSLPDDDVEVVYLLKRSLAHLAPHQITVVDHDDEKPALTQHAARRRYVASWSSRATLPKSKSRLR